MHILTHVDTRCQNTLAERTGFEPADQFPGHRFSKPALSTTQPPLRASTAKNTISVGTGKPCGPTDRRAEADSGARPAMVQRDLDDLERDQQTGKIRSPPSASVVRNAAPGSPFADGDVAPCPYADAGQYGNVDDAGTWWTAAHGTTTSLASCPLCVDTPAPTGCGQQGAIY